MSGVALIPARGRPPRSRRAIEARFRAIPTRVNENGVDEFGFDPEFAAKMAPLFTWLYDKYFRVEAHGVGNVPDGRCLIIANHSGQLPFDAMMIGTAVMFERERPRMLRTMVEKFITDLPFFSYIFERMGQLVGTPENCRRLLQNEEAILVFPEGVRGIGKLFNERYMLKSFGLGFMRLALETKTPIVPVAVVGAEEQAPALFSAKKIGRFFGLPPLPITPTTFLMPPLGLLPYPVKYRIYFGEPLHFEGDPNDEDAEVEAKVKKVESAIRVMLERGLRARKNIFW